MALRAPAALNGGTLTLRVAGSAFTVTFAGVATAADVIDQIQRAGRGAVRASIGGAGLSVETVSEGTAATIQVDAAASTVLAAGGPLGSPPAASAQGSGDVADGRRVQLDEVRAVVANAAIGPPGNARSQPLELTVRQDRGGGVETFAGRSSRGPGAGSAVELLSTAGAAGGFAGRLAEGPPQLRLDRSMSRVPRGGPAVTLPPFTDAAGNPSSVLSPRRRGVHVRRQRPGVRSRCPDRRPRRLRRLLHRRASGGRDRRRPVGGRSRVRGVHLDQVIVIETLTPGLAGTVQVPAAGQPSTGAVLVALGLDAASLAAGARLATVRVPRSRRTGASQRDLAVRRSGTVRGHDRPVGGRRRQPADAALRGDPSGANRVGLARDDVDGALAVDFFAATASTSPEAVAVAEDVPRAVERWRGAEAAVDPAFELRSTRVVRTARMVFVDGLGGADPFADPTPWGTGNFEVFDLGWGARPTDGNGVDQDIQRWAPGRWLIAACVAGARLDTFVGDQRTRAYSSAGEMIASAGSATVGGERLHFPHVVRYWVEFDRQGTNISALRMVQRGSEFLLDHVHRS